MKEAGFSGRYVKNTKQTCSTIKQEDIGYCWPEISRHIAVQLCLIEYSHPTKSGISTYFSVEARGGHASPL